MDRGTAFAMETQRYLITSVVCAVRFMEPILLAMGTRAANVNKAMGSSRVSVKSATSSSRTTNGLAIASVAVCTV